jgi:IPT/TIG domain
MAQVEYGPIVKGACGSVEGVTFTEGQNGNQIRGKQHQCNQFSPSQQEARSIASEVSKAWQLLPDTQRAAWKAAAATRVNATCLGRHYRPTGYSLWNELNLTRLNNGETLITTPPPPWTVPPINNVSILPTFTGPTTTTLQAFWDETIPSLAAVQLETTPPYSFGAQPDTHRLQILTTFPPSTTPFQDITDAFTAVYGTPPTTTPYKIGALFTPINASTGVKGCPIPFILAIAAPANTPPLTPGTSCATAVTITPNVTYTFAGDTSNQAWILLPVTTGWTYVLSFSATTSTPPATIYEGASCGSLTALATLQGQDAVTWTAQPGQLYWLATGPWTTGNTWTALFQLKTWPGPPTVTSVTPSSGVSAYAQRVSITGTDFTRRDVVYFGSTPTIHSWFKGPTLIEALTPYLPIGTVDVTVHQADGCSPISAADEYTATGEQAQGGLEANGASTDVFTVTETSSGGGIMGGTSADTITVTEQATGGLVAGTTSTDGTTTAEQASGGLVAGTTSTDGSGPVGRNWAAAFQTSANTQTINFGTTTTAGSTLIAGLILTGATPTGTPTGWTLKTTTNLAAGTNLYVYEWKNATAQNSVTWTFSAVCASGALIGELAYAVASSFDQTAPPTTGMSSAAATGTTPATTQAPEISVSIVGWSGNNAPSAWTNSYLQQASTGSTTNGVAAATKNLPTTTTTQTTATLPGTTTWGATIQTYA